MRLAGLHMRAIVAACAQACDIQRPPLCMLGNLTFVLLRRMFMEALVPLPLVEAVAIFWANLEPGPEVHWNSSRFCAYLCIP